MQILIKKSWSLDPIFLLVKCAVLFFLVNQLQAASPQFQLGDKVSIYSDKAFRKNGGEFFEAIGNVVIISEKDTMYGESASFDRTKMVFKMEGNVRLIANGMTLYGSHLEYNAVTGHAIIKNARLIQADFVVIAKQIERITEKQYIADEAEFTTCRDCTESWAVYGKKMIMNMGEYAVIHHGLARIKGVNILYIPLLAFPIQTKRKTGLLFPDISTRIGEGLAFEQPFFWAIDQHKDATISPTLWAQRGYGGDLEYRHHFGQDKWVSFNSRLLQDSIYLPGKTGQNKSGENYFRYFGEVENSWRWSPNLNHHLRYTGARDLDVIRDHPQYTDPKTISSEMGFSGFADYRQDRFAISLQSDYWKNQLTDDPVEFDGSYVQVLPKVALASTPYSLFQTDIPFLQHLAIGADSSFTRFRQVDADDSLKIRNADRVTVNPYIFWEILNKGPFELKSTVTGDYQSYLFPEIDRKVDGKLQNNNFEKNSILTKTQFSFRVDRVFGLAYERKVDVDELSSSEARELQKGQVKEEENKKDRPLKDSNTVGSLEDFETSVSSDEVVIQKNSYRHAQEYSFIHHYIPVQNLSGNRQFENQISTNDGWFDYLDAVRAKEYLSGVNQSRAIIPPNNTFEFQWNNNLVRKSPQKAVKWDTDRRYLRDNFSYNKVGFFNVSQGYILDKELPTNKFEDRLTRLLIQAGFGADRWSFNFSENFFYNGSEHIFNAGFNREFDQLRFFSSYTYSSLNQAKLEFLSLGTQIRVTDILGFSILREMDLEAKEIIRNIYSVNFMPLNNCWIFNLNYRESLVDKRYSFNLIFNFGNQEFQLYKNSQFAPNAFN
jgi:LPS-assembly protein